MWKLENLVHLPFVCYVMLIVRSQDLLGNCLEKPLTQMEDKRGMVDAADSRPTKRVARARI